MQSSIEKKQQILDVVAEMYGLPVCQLLQDLALWGETWRWHISMKDGKHYFLKEKADFLTEEAFVLQQHLHAFTYENGGPVVKLYETTQGTWYLTIDGRLFTLQEYCPVGHPDPTNRADIEELGKTLSRFHKRAESFRPGHLANQGDWSLQKLRANYFPEIWQEITSYTYHLDRLYQHVGYTDCSALLWLRGWITRQGHALNTLTFSTTWIHGDINCFNCLGNSQMGMVLIDTDSFHWGYRLSDVALAAASVGMIYQLAETDEPTLYQTLRTEYIHALLRGVEEIFPFTEVERQCWPIFLGFGMVRALIDYTELYVTNKHLSRDLKVFVERTIAMLSTLV